VKPAAVIVAGVLGLAVVGGGAWFASRAGTDGPIMQVMNLCATLPDPSGDDRAMADRGWRPAGEEDHDSIVYWEGLQYLAGRRAGMEDWDLEAELANAEGHTTRFRDRRLTAAGMKLYKRDSGAGYARLERPGDMPETLACDVWLPGPMDGDAFRAMLKDKGADRDTGGFARFDYTRGQGPRPGLWVAQVTEVDAAKAGEALGETPELTIFATAAWRGTLPQ
jgi:hypothetical protein